MKSGFVLAALGMLASCSPSAQRTQIDNVVLITLDTVRADALGGYGRSPSVTPAIDALAREGQLYLDAHTVAPLTAPAHASMLTGLVPLRHSVRNNGAAPLPDDALTIAEMARKRGIDTAAFLSSSVLDRAFGLDQGFELYDAPERTEAAHASFSQRNARETVRAANAWLRKRDASKRFLLWVHLFDAHAPYTPPEAFLQEAGGDAYLGEVAFVDAAVGELVAELRERGELERTLIVLVADHGESLGEHGEPTHGTLCYEATLHVPLVVRYPDGFGAGERRDDPASVVDVAPTIVEALELGSATGVDGFSLYRRRVPPERGAYFECYSGYLDHGWSPLAGWIDADGKYIASSAPELYDLERDPRELKNLLPAHESARPKFEQQIADIAALPRLTSSAGYALEPELEKELRALGYSGAGVLAETLPEPLSRLDRGSPVERYAELHAFLEATSLLEQREFEHAATLLETVVRSNPRDALALDQLGFALLQLERFDEARAALEQRLTLPTHHAETFVNLALCCEKLGESEAASAYARAALELDPRSRLAQEVLERVKAN